MKEKMWMCHGKDSHGRNRIWFAPGKEKPSNEQEYEHGDWEYFCDGKLDGQELERFMMKHRRLCIFKQENGLCKERVETTEEFKEKRRWLKY